MPELIPVLTEQEIEKKVQKLADDISREYMGKDLLMVGVLKGSFIFMADLVRKISIPIMIDFISASSYGNSDTSSGEVKIKKDLSVGIKNRHILLIEDIVDTGITVSYLRDYLISMEPESVKVCAFIDKPERRQKDIRADFVGHAINEGFLVGYGLDYAEQYRHLPAVYHLKF